MYIIAWSNTLSVDFWHAYESLDDARRLYNELTNSENVYTVSLLAVIESSDYSPSCTCNKDEPCSATDTLSQSGSISEGAAPSVVTVEGDRSLLNLPYYDCCRHCPDNCTMSMRHLFSCNMCQPRVGVVT